MPLKRVINKPRLAEALGISYQAVYQWFYKGHLPTSKTLLKAAKLLQITPQELADEIQGPAEFKNKLHQATTISVSDKLREHEENKPNMIQQNFYKNIRKVIEE